MSPDLSTAIAQFGAAGLIGWMWLTERRAGAARERLLTEAHQKLIHERQAFDLAVAALQENTRALTALEVGQRTLTGVLQQLGGRA